MLPLSANFRKVHYTFDFSQNVAFPHHARQMGPLYFLSLKKVHIFDFRVDDKSMQYNYLIGENETLEPDGTKAHGPDTVTHVFPWFIMVLATMGMAKKNV